MAEDVDDAYLQQFDPYRDDVGWVSEDPHEYAVRMQRTLLPEWPEEVLVEWFHRHAGHLYDYASLCYERFHFKKEHWPLAKIPGREVFANPDFCEDFQDIERRANYPHDWLAKYMLEHGTWNTLIILLRTPSRGMTGPENWPFRYPLHLLEGHRRLSFLVRLRGLGKAQAAHDVWLVTLSHLSANAT